ncbi:MAG TPA: hypothetical protein VGO22_20250 [Pseudorhizobium sp.]|nr:hypothetical protein [Pseudorhizobium sp.]
MCSSEAIDFPYFADFRIDDQPHTQRNVIADVIWFLLAYEYHPGGGRANPSLSKVHFLLENNAFRYRWPISRRTFQTFWAANAAAAPFLYVEQAHSTLDWAIDPLAVTFSDDVDDLLGQEQAVSEYFARCRWAVEELQARLDRRALERIAFPLFPDGTATEELRPRALTPLIRETLLQF